MMWQDLGNSCKRIYRYTFIIDWVRLFSAFSMHEHMYSRLLIAIVIRVTPSHLLTPSKAQRYYETTNIE